MLRERQLVAGPLSAPVGRIALMSAPSARSCPCASVTRLDRTQAEIRALTEWGMLSAAERLELAGWQREWVAAWQENVTRAA